VVTWKLLLLLRLGTLSCGVKDSLVEVAEGKIRHDSLRSMRTGRCCKFIVSGHVLSLSGGVRTILDCGLLEGCETFGAHGRPLVWIKLRVVLRINSSSIRRQGTFKI
jgi:hypothetical protein